MHATANHIRNRPITRITKRRPPTKRTWLGHYPRIARTLPCLVTKTESGWETGRELTQTYALNRAGGNNRQTRSPIPNLKDRWSYQSVRVAPPYGRLLFRLDRPRQSYLALSERHKLAWCSTRPWPPPSSIVRLILPSPFNHSAANDGHVQPARHGNTAAVQKQGLAAPLPCSACLNSPLHLTRPSCPCRRLY